MKIRNYVIGFVLSIVGVIALVSSLILVATATWGPAWIFTLTFGALSLIYGVYVLFMNMWKDGDFKTLFDEL